MFVFTMVHAQDKIIVDAQGKGDFNTIQAALNSLTDSSGTARIIFIKRGTYKEKVFITKHQVILEGEDRDKTIITGMKIICRLR